MCGSGPNPGGIADERPSFEGEGETGRETPTEQLDVDDLVTSYVDALPTVFYVLDTSGCLVDWNHQLEAVTGRDGDTLSGMHVTALVADGDADPVGDWLDQVLEEAMAATVEAELATGSGSSVPHQFEAGPLVDDDGTVVGVTGTASDSSAERARQREYEAKTARLERFVSIVSHDLRNPLAVAEGYLDLAQSEGGGEHLADIQAAHDRMWELIDTLLQLAQEGGDPVGTDQVALDRVVRDAWTGVATEQASLSVDGDLGTVQADRGRLSQLFENLFRNCVEHGSTDGPAHSGVAVIVRPTADGFCVVDDGPGLPEDRDDLFADGVTTKPGGTGLGLAIVASVAESHGWSVDASESDTGGARFDVRT